MSRQDELFAHAAVTVNADDLKIVTAIGMATFAGVAVGIVHVRFNAAAVADFDVRYSVADFHDFHSQLMAGRAWKLKERKLAQVCRRVGAADADAVDLHFGFARARCGWVIDINNGD